ncbi:TPM domain-containing protein [Clostridium carnis]
MSFKNKYLKIFLSSLFILILFFYFPVSASDSLPSPTNYKYLNDYVGVINDTDTKKIVSIGKELEDKTGAQAVIVIINTTNNVPIEEYAIKLFRSWGIGQKSKDNGLLILLAIEDRAWRVEVGRGLEGAIPDALSNRVMTTLAKPSFINNNYGEGLINSYSTFCDYIGNEYGVKLDKSLNIVLPDNSSNSTSNIGIAIISGILILSLFLDVIFNGGRVSSTMLQLIFWSNLNRRNGPRGGSGGSGGGFGGFGGGSSNGGGSSGGW